MTDVLGDQLDALDRRVRSDAWVRTTDLDTLFAEVEDAVALSLALLASIDKGCQADPALRPEAWTRDAARRHLPAYDRWYAMATSLLATIKRLRAGGMPVTEVDSFVREYMRVKLVAVEFDRNADLLERAGSGASVATGQDIHELHVADGERRAG